jgi:hypothetical protein
MASSVVTAMAAEENARPSSRVVVTLAQRFMIASFFVMDGMCAA